MTTVIARSKATKQSSPLSLLTGKISPPESSRALDPQSRNLKEPTNINYYFQFLLDRGFKPAIAKIGNFFPSPLVGEDAQSADQG